MLLRLPAPIQVGSIRCHLRAPACPTMSRHERRTGHSADRYDGREPTFCASVRPFVPASPKPPSTRSLRWGDLWWRSRLRASVTRSGRLDRCLQTHSPSTLGALEGSLRAPLERTRVRFRAWGLLSQYRSVGLPKSALHHLLVDQGPAQQRRVYGCSQPRLCSVSFERCGPFSADSRNMHISSGKNSSLPYSTNGMISNEA